MRNLRKKTAVLLLATMLCVPIVGRAETGEVLETIELQESESLEYETTTYDPLEVEIESKGIKSISSNIAISPYSSAVLNETTWGFNKNACTLIYSFLRSSSGSLDITLQKENSDGTWKDVATKYHSFSFTTLTNTSIPVSNLLAGTYQIKTQIYAVVNGTVYEETKYTGTRRLY